VGLLEERAKVVHGPPGVGVLDEDAEAARGRRKRAMVAHDDLDAERLGSGADDVDRLRVAAVGDEEGAVGGGVALPEPVAHHHGLGGRGALVEHRGVGDLEARQVADHRLEVEERLEAALGDLGLVGRVRRVPGGVLEDRPLDDARDQGVVVAHPYEVPEHLVVGGDRPQLAKRGALSRGGGKPEGPAADVCGHRRVDERVHARISQLGEHGRGVGAAVAQVTPGEGVIRAGEFALRRHAVKR